MTKSASDTLSFVVTAGAVVEGVEEVHASSSPRGSSEDDASQTRSLYADLARQLKGAGSLRIVAERAFGRLDAKKAILGARQQALSEAGMDPKGPLTYIECPPVRGASPAGVQLTLVRPKRAADVTPLRGDGGSGFVVATGNVRRAWLSSVHGVEAGRSAQAQAALMFERAHSLLAPAGMTWRNVACTRIYIKRLLEWYGEFNEVRNLFYRKLGLIGSGRFDVPSSTGIQGKMSDDCECAMDVFAASTGPAGAPVFEKLHSAVQNEATEYGSSFARGARVEMGTAAYVFVSGTASIDAKGKSVHVGDTAAQARQTMDSFEAVLRGGRATVDDLVQGTCFCKDRSSAGAVEEEMRARGWPGFPWPVVVADVCRHDLLVELDGMAVTTAGR